MDDSKCCVLMGKTCRLARNRQQVDGDALVRAQVRDAPVAAAGAEARGMQKRYDPNLARPDL